MLAIYLTAEQPEGGCWCIFSSVALLSRVNDTIKLNCSDGSMPFFKVYAPLLPASVSSIFTRDHLYIVPWLKEKEHISEDNKGRAGVDQ